MQSPVNWQQFGLKNNPYDTFPLVEGGDISIKDAFVGRIKERQFLDSIFESENRVCLTICGDTGVGKTSLANFHKFIWKYSTPKLLFSFRREIEACEDLLDKKSFIIEILASVLREIKLLDPDLLKNEFLVKAQSIVDISQSLTISGGLSVGWAEYKFGVDLSKQNNIAQPIKFSTSVLEEYLSLLVEFIQQNPIGGYTYSGLVIHVNNFDVLLSKKENEKRVVRFFNEIRDLLQTKKTYFLFLGPKNLFRDIVSKEQRVKSIFFQTPLILNPLTKTEVVEAFEERMRSLKSDGVTEYIKPVNDEVIFQLYDLYEGDIRSIMSAVRDIIGYYSEKLINQLSVDEAMVLLGKERIERIENFNQLTPEQKKILNILVREKHISQKEVAKILNKPQSNISGYYFKPLKEAGIIEEKHRNGKTIYWGLTKLYEPLKWVYESKKQIESDIEQSVTQNLTLFESND